MRGWLTIVAILTAFNLTAGRDSTWKVQVSPTFQLGSTKYTTNLTLDIYKRNHLFYAGAKSQLTNSFSYGKLPMGVVLGYAHRLLHRGKWHYYINPDMQWLSWKSPTKTTRNHHLDFTLNYRLSYRIVEHLSLNSSMGFGFSIRHNKNEALNTSITRPEVNGMIQVGFSYLF